MESIIQYTYSFNTSYAWVKDSKQFYASFFLLFFNTGEELSVLIPLPENRNPLLKKMILFYFSFSVCIKQKQKNSWPKTEKSEQFFLFRRILVHHPWVNQGHVGLGSDPFLLTWLLLSQFGLVIQTPNKKIYINHHWTNPNILLNQNFVASKVGPTFFYKNDCHSQPNFKPIRAVPSVRLISAPTAVEIYELC